jgi:Ca-activated chloride channel family protein
MSKNFLWLLAAVVVLAAMSAGTALSRRDPGQASVSADPAAGAIKITLASSSTKKDWIEEAVRDFNQASRSDSTLQVEGKPAFVEILKEELEPGVFEHYRSGTMVTDTLAGRIKPTMLSPAEQSWLDQLNREWQLAHRDQISTGTPVTLVRTPVVLAMWQSRAEALGCWPLATSNCTWQRVHDLAASPQGWGMVGHPEWGKLKIGYGYVGESNSGTLMAALLCMVGAGKPTGLTVADVAASSGCGQMMHTVEQAKVHSGKKSSWLLGWMETGGPEYLDAVTTQEQDVIVFNRDHGAKLREPLVAAYMQDGTVVAEHPTAILDGADWVSAEQATAARLFITFLRSNAQQQALQRTGLRPADATAKPVSPIEPRFGANPEAPIVALAVPDALTLARITEVWHQVKKHAIIALVFDKSGSMQGEKLSTAITGAKAFVDAMDPEDILIWMPFDDRVYAGPQGPKSEIGERLLSNISSTSASGGTALYDTIGQARTVVDGYRATRGDTVRYGIVVLSDGKDSGSRQSTLALLQASLVPAEGNPAGGIQMHTIGIGSDADASVLTSLANGANGKYWSAKDPKRVVEVYREIAVHY